MNVAVIPARGGSKRIPNKNIKLFAGKPIIAYSIEAARLAGIFDRILVSTDSETIARVANQCGAEVPFLRPAELADDHTPTAPVVAHTLHWLAASGCPAAHVCCIYATAPFVRPEYVIEGYHLLTEYKVSSVFSVTPFPFPILRALKIAEDGHVALFWPEYELTRSNDLPAAYHDAGQFYWLACAAFLQDQKMYGRDALPVILPRYLVQDIDTPEDWETAEHMFHALQLRTASRGGLREW
jgi:pseudaminic acid cytidylyltransferase